MSAPALADDEIRGAGRSRPGSLASPPGDHRLRLAVASAAIALALCAAAHAGAQGAASETRVDPGLLRSFAAAGVPAEPLSQAMRAYTCGSARGEFARPVLTLIDYSRPSTEPRLWVLDLAERAVRFRTLVAHGRGSGLGRAVAFSNIPDSKQSSLGLFRTDETYDGQHGYSLRLVGLEAGVNDLAYSRNIVIHGANYATAKFASRHGRLGRSWGCPALDPSVHRELIDAIRDRTALFAYYPDARWLAGSAFLRCNAAPAPGEPVSIARRESQPPVPSALAPLAALTVIRGAD